MQRRRSCMLLHQSIPLKVLGAVLFFWQKARGCGEEALVAQKKVDVGSVTGI